MNSFQDFNSCLVFFFLGGGGTMLMKLDGLNLLLLLNNCSHTKLLIHTVLMLYLQLKSEDPELKF